MRSSVQAVQGSKACVAFVSDDPNVVLYTCPRLQGKLLLFDYRSSSPLQFVQFPQPISSLAVSKVKDSLVALGGCGGTVYVLRSQGTKISELTGHRGMVQSLIFTSQDTLTSCSRCDMIQWDVPA